MRLIRLAAVALALVIGAAVAEPVKINPAWCPEYARDARHAADLKAQGQDLNAAIAAFEQHRGDYPKKMWPHVLQLIQRAYDSELTPEAFEATTARQCIEAEGWIDREA